MEEEDEVLGQDVDDIIEILFKLKLKITVVSANLLPPRIRTVIFEAKFLNYYSTEIKSNMIFVVVFEYFDFKVWLKYDTGTVFY